MKQRLKKAFAAVAAVFALAAPVGPVLAGEKPPPRPIVVETSTTGSSPVFADVVRSLSCPDVSVKSLHSQYIGGLQKKFGRLPGHTPLVILDHDEIRRCQGLLMKDMTLTGKRAAFDAALIAFIKGAVGVDLSLDIARGRADDMLEGKTSAGIVFGPDRRPALTVLIPGNPDQSIYTALQDFSVPDRPRPDQAFLNDALRSQKIVSNDVFRMWGDVHEIMHGLDNNYNVRIWESEGAQRLVFRHRAEMFADVASVLYLAASDVAPGPDLARFVADLRTINAVPSVGAEEGSLQLDAVYYTSPGLRAAANYISEQGDKLRGHSVEKILSVAGGLVRANALDRASMGALVRHMRKEPPLRSGVHPVASAYDDEVQLARLRLQRQIEAYYDRQPTDIEKQEVSMGFYSDLMVQARTEDKDAGAFAARIARTRDDLRARFVYGLSTIDENEIENLLEETARAAIDAGPELREKTASGAKPRPKPSRPPPRR